MAIPEIAAWVKKARKEGWSDGRISQSLRGAGWKEGQVLKAIAQTRTVAPNRNAAVNKINQLPYTLWRVIKIVLFIFELLLLVRISYKYLAVATESFFGALVYGATEWLVAPWEGVVSVVITRPFVAEYYPVILDKILWIKEGSIEVTAVAAYFVYGVIILFAQKIFMVVMSGIRKRRMKK